MGEFAEVLKYAPRNTYESVCIALNKKEDGSFDEFYAALTNHEISCTAIAVAIRKSTGIKVTSRSVQRWRIELAEGTK